jgi:hypothetical protein
VKIPILGPIGNVLLPLAGRLLKGKLTNAGVIVAATGMAASGAQSGDVFESIKALVDLAQQAWPHLLVLVGGVMAVAGWFRKAGWAAAAKQSGE